MPRGMRAVLILLDHPLLQVNVYRDCVHDGDVYCCMMHASMRVCPGGMFAQNIMSCWNLMIPSAMFLPLAIYLPVLLY